MLLNPFELAVVTLFHSFAILRRHWIHWTTFESLSLHLLMNFSFWWYSASDELAFDKFFAFFCSSRTYKWSQNFCLWSCTLEQILAFPINNFLIPCYHSKLLRVMLNTFCSNRTHFLKTSFLKPITSPFGLSECVPLATTPILMVDFYWNPWRTKLYLSQGLLDYSHVLQSLSNFTCSDIKTSSFGPSLSICDDELTSTNPSMTLFEFDTC